jgi:putative pyruvate formate lyase activating enzyme
MPKFEPAYLKLLRNGELAQRVAQAHAMLASCCVCAWECRVDRLAGKLGICRTAEHAMVSSYGPHMGEEDPLRGWGGSGTIFFSRCNLPASSARTTI